jgi:K(+)-stimulated pyrophosphate-energized sodium pump
MAPIAVGFGLGVGALGAYLAGAIGTGTLMAVFLSNSGGAWDNAKKMVEDGNYGGKGSDAHAATIVGDTVGDPFKDTAGPAINPLIKVMNLVGLLITPAIVSFALPTQQSTSLIIAAVATLLIIGSLIRNRRQATSIDY